MNRKLTADSSGRLASPSGEIDVEVRKVWQPWLRRKCDFVVRYIVPHRPSLCRILASNGQFRAEVRKDFRFYFKLYLADLLLLCSVGN